MTRAVKYLWYYLEADTKKRIKMFPSLMKYIFLQKIKGGKRMKKMKKWAALGLAAVMVLSMTACGSSGGDTAGDAAAESGGAESGGGRIRCGKQRQLRR